MSGIVRLVLHIRTSILGRKMAVLIIRIKLIINTAMTQDYTDVITEVCQLLFNAIRSRESLVPWLPPGNGG